MRWIGAVLGGAHRHWDDAALLAPDALAQLAADQGVAALLHARLEAGAVRDAPHDLRKRLALADLQAQGVEAWRARELRRVTSSLSAIGCDVLLLKGSALARWAYPAAHQRARADIDLLFRSRLDIERSQPALAALGYGAVTAVVNGLTYEAQFVRDDGGGRISAIDAHWRMSNHPVFADRFTFDELFADSMPLGDDGHDRGLGLVHAFIHAALHRVSNLAIGAGDRLIWLYDLHLMSARLAMPDWERLAQLALSRQIAGPCASAMRACTRWLDTSWPEAVLSQLEAAASRESFQVERAHWRWYHEWKGLLSLPLAARPTFLLHKLFPQPAYMRERYGTRRAWQLPAAYLRRWSIGFGVFMRYWFRWRRS